MASVGTEVVAETPRRGWYANLVDAIRDLANGLHIDSVRRFAQLAIDQTDAGTASQKAEILFYLANAELHSGAIEKGLRYVEEGMQLDPSSDFIKINAVISYMNFCYFDRAIEIARSLVDSKDYGDRAWQALMYLQDVNFCTDRAARRRMEAGYADYLSRSGLVAKSARPLAPVGQRKIRVGYVYSRWNYPPIQRLLKKLIESHDQGRFEIFCYASPSMTHKLPDALTSAPACWVSLMGLDERAVIKRLLADALDILVDLDGIAMTAPMTLYRQRPAPIMVGWFGAVGGFGGLFDYLIADPVVAPEEERGEYREKILYLPQSYLVFSDDGGVAGFADSPCVKQGRITFGSCNRPDKFHQGLADSWARIVKAVENSRLLLCHSAYRSEFWRERMLGFLQQSGLSSDRYLVAPLRLDGADPSDDEQSFDYGDIDIVLDSFPFNALTTTFETLQRSIPMVTWHGNDWRGRIGASLLQAVGLEELIGRSMEEYEALAVALAQDRSRLTRLRSVIRPRLLASPIVDIAALSSNIEDLFNRMIADRCALDEQVS